MNIKVKGLGEITQALRRTSAGLPDAVGAGEEAAGQIIMVDAKRRAPFEDGELESSGYCTRAEVSGTGKTVVVEMGFGGPISSAYALRQHENHYNHPTKGERYYFVNAINAKRREAQQAIRAAMLFYLKHKRPMPVSRVVPTSPNHETTRG